jgi:predicted flap endonuclease-1-like 5' DNA nuclease
MLRCNMTGAPGVLALTGARRMALSQEFPGGLSGATVIGERAERALRVPFGMASPLWAMYGAAAGVGVAYWWMTQWTRAVNFEALAPFAGKSAVGLVAAPAASAKVEAAVAPAQELAEEIVEAVAAPAEEAIAEIAASVTEAAPQAVAVADDLTRMTGIGPKLAAALASRGVTRFTDIAAWTADDLAEVDASLSLKGRAVREAWVAQAKRLAD